MGWKIKAERYCVIDLKYCHTHRHVWPVKESSGERICNCKKVVNKQKDLLLLRKANHDRTTTSTQSEKRKINNFSASYFTVALRRDQKKEKKDSREENENKKKNTMKGREIEEDDMAGPCIGTQKPIRNKNTRSAWLDQWAKRFADVPPLVPSPSAPDEVGSSHRTSHHAVTLRGE